MLNILVITTQRFRDDQHKIAFNPRVLELLNECVNVIGANLEAEDSDGDTALHLVLLQMKNSREAATAMTFLLNVLFRVQPKNLEQAPAIKKACRLRIILCHSQIKNYK